jgi:hypothetical protein
MDEINDKVKLLLNNNYYDFTKHYGYIKSIEYRNNRYLYDVLVIGYYDYDEAKRENISPHKMLQFLESEIKLYN